MSKCGVIHDATTKEKDKSRSFLICLTRCVTLLTTWMIHTTVYVLVARILYTTRPGIKIQNGYVPLDYTYGVW